MRRSSAVVVQSIQDLFRFFLLACTHCLNDRMATTAMCSSLYARSTGSVLILSGPFYFWITFLSAFFSKPNSISLFYFFLLCILYLVSRVLKDLHTPINFFSSHFHSPGKVFIVLFFPTNFPFLSPPFCSPKKTAQLFSSNNYFTVLLFFIPFFLPKRDRSPLISSRKSNSLIFPNNSFSFLLLRPLFFSQDYPLPLLFYLGKIFILILPLLPPF